MRAGVIEAESARVGMTAGYDQFPTHKAEKDKARKSRNANVAPGEARGTATALAPGA